MRTRMGVQGCGIGQGEGWEGPMWHSWLDAQIPHASVLNECHEFIVINIEAGVFNEQI